MKWLIAFLVPVSFCFSEPIYRQDIWHDIHENDFFSAKKKIFESLDSLENEAEELQLYFILLTVAEMENDFQMSELSLLWIKYLTSPIDE